MANAGVHDVAIHIRIYIDVDTTACSYRWYIPTNAIVESSLAVSLSNTGGNARLFFDDHAYASIRRQTQSAPKMSTNTL